MNTENVLTRRERKKLTMRKKIIETALKLFEQTSFAETTMEQIAEEADIAKGTLYNYFPVKEAILTEYIRCKTKHLEKALFKDLTKLPDTRTRLLEFFRNLSLVFAENIDFMKALLAYRFRYFYDTMRDEKMRSGAKDIVREIIQYGKKKGELRSDISIESLVNFLELNLLGYLVYQADNETFQGPDEEQIAKIIDLFLNGALQREEAP